MDEAKRQQLIQDVANAATGLSDAIASGSCVFVDDYARKLAKAVMECANARD